MLRSISFSTNSAAIIAAMKAHALTIEERQGERGGTYVVIGGQFGPIEICASMDEAVERVGTLMEQAS